jgi:hypothetical protein
MLTHIVLFKLKDRAIIDTARERLAALDGRIESLRSLEVGVDIVQGERSFDIALVATFDDRAGLEAYRVHPLHVEVADYIKGESSSVVSADYE